MNNLFCFAILLVFGVGIQAELNAKRNFDWKSTRNKILNDQEEFNHDYETLLLELAKNRSRDCEVDVVLSSNGCSVCDRILGVLMSASMQSFLTINDNASSNDSFIYENSEAVPDGWYFKFVIFLTENVLQFFQHFANLRLKSAWNPRARHVIFTAKQPDPQQLEMIFAECWSRKVHNVAVIINNRAEAFTYNPYLNDHLEMREKVDWSRMFYDKLRNMNGFLIPVKMILFSGNVVAKWIKEEKRFAYYGMDFGHTEIFFQSINATPAYVNLTDDMVILYKNFTYRNEAWNMRVFGDFDLWMNSMPIDIIFPKRSEKTYPVGRDDLRILVPKSGVKTPSIFEPYNNITWSCIVVSLIIFASYSNVLYKLRGIDDNAFFRTFGIFLGKNLAKRRHGFVEKFTFLIFTMSSLLIISAYQGALYGALTTVSYYPEINTMPELYKRIKVIHTYHAVAEYFRPYVKSSIKVVEFSKGEYVDYMKTHRHDAYAIPNNLGRYIAKRKVLVENGVPLFHVMDEYALPAFQGLTVPYGSPYLEKLDAVLLRCKEVGLDEYWDAEAKLFDLLSGTVISNAAEERSLKKLSLRTQLYGFYIWGMGLLMSSLCCAAEIYFHKNGQRIMSRTRRVTVHGDCQTQNVRLGHLVESEYRSNH